MHILWRNSQYQELHISGYTIINYIKMGLIWLRDCIKLSLKE